VNPDAESFQDRVSNWSDLTNLIEHFSYYNLHDWLFRGVTDAAHGLVPKIGREKLRKIKRRPGTKERVRVPYRTEDELAVMSMFKQQARAYLPSPPVGELEWLAIAQHYGLPTRLLDWTDSLLVAAWFAVEGGGGNKADSAIWVTKGIQSLALDYSGDPFSLDKPAAYRPPHISSRISAQGSVLMICPTPTDELALGFSRKIVIDRKAEFTLKKRLNACGINRRHLFPDLGGLAEHLAWMYKNDWLAGYRQRGSVQRAAIGANQQN
jgi:hypothetical protein